MAQKYIGIVLPARRGKVGMFDSSTTLLQQVRSNFKNLILTKKGERVGQPELGCDLWKILFEPLTEETLENARLSIADAVDFWMPFIELTDFQITKTDDDNILNVKCTYLFRNNPNVTDQVSILTSELGLPTVETTTPLLQSENTKSQNSTRIRRPT